MRIADWVIAKLEPLRERPRILVRDPLRLLPERDSQLHDFAVQHAFTVIVAATNLVFRELYASAQADPLTQKLLVVDRAPMKRRTLTSVAQAPAPFYPDLLAVTPDDARIDLDLRQLLCERTNDPNWPQEVNDGGYARLIAPHLNDVIRAHRNLQTAHAGRFTDDDLQRIVAFAALGVSESAFKKLGAQDYWKIGLVGHEALESLETLAPDVTKAIKAELRKAPAPFSWLATRDPDTVIRAFYLSVILAQHLDNWRLLLANLDPALAQLSAITPAVMNEAAPKLVQLDPEQAQRDVESVEASLDRETLQTLLFEHLHLATPANVASVLEHERYSNLLRCLALFLALDNALGQPDAAAQQRVSDALFTEPATKAQPFVERRQSPIWSNLKEAYRLAQRIREAQRKLTEAVRELRVAPPEERTCAYFWRLWNEQRLNRVEYDLSALRRLLDSAELLPRSEADLPAHFGKTLQGLQQRARMLYDAIYAQLDDLNRIFQEIVATQYPTWLTQDTDLRLTNQFLRRFVKPHWDPQTEKAVIFVFDGMRYDIWDELLRPLLEDRLEVIEDAMAASILPSETHVSRWALAAGEPPKEFLYPHRGENVFLEAALKRDFDLNAGVKSWSDGSGIGETVRYRAGALDYYIFEFCDKELHKIQLRTLAGGRQEPSRPMVMVYQQLKSFLETEVMAIVRKLEPGTKVFITADHGFGPIRDQALWFDAQDLNEPDDCSYRNCRLRVPFDQANLPTQARQQMIAFTPDQLGMPRREPYPDRASGQTAYKECKAIVFPRVGYAFSRQGSAFRPSAYSHGGISLQELVIPMVALRVRSKDEGILTLGQIAGPTQPVEGEEMEFRLHVGPSSLIALNGDDLRLTVEASYSRDPDRSPLPTQTLYVGTQGIDVSYRFRADRSDATEEELRHGRMRRVLTISVGYHEGRRAVRQARTFEFTVQLNTERVARRVPPNLGNILGLMPRNAG